MNKDNNLGRVLALLSLTSLMSFGLYSLPDTLFGYKIKKADLLSDFKMKEKKLSSDSLKQRLEQADIPQIDSVALRDSIMRSAGIDSAVLALRDSLYKAVCAVQGAGPLGARIEDYSLGHIGLQRFFAALKNRRELNRPVHVAFLGDSSIEGDIMVADFRSGMQEEFGGRGVGLVPVTSVAAQFHPTVEQRASGWTTWSVLTDHEHGHTLSGMMFEVNEKDASIHVKTTKRYPELQTFSSSKLIYEQNKNTEMRLVCNASADTLQEMLPATSIVAQYELEGVFIEADFTFKNTPEFRALGVAMEDHSGVVVGNFPLQGNPGMILERLDVSRYQALNKIRPYDLIVLQYGSNVTSDSVMNYGWYSSRVVKVISHIRPCSPEADILMLGMSDRSCQDDGEFETMPTVLALLYAQRQAAKKAGVPFRNVLGAMGGENSMVRFVGLNWVSKDYTHLSFRGGRETVDILLRALLPEKDFYDEAEKVVN